MKSLSLASVPILIVLFTFPAAHAGPKQIKDPKLLIRLNEELDKLKSGNPGERASAARALGSLGDGRAIVPLAGLLADEDERVRIAAARALGKIGDPAVIPELTLCLDRDEVPLTLAVIDAFLEIESPKAVPVLIVLIRHDDERVRLAALEAVAALPDPSATTIILGYLKTAPPKERVRAAVVLGSLDDERAVPALLNLLEDNSSGVRAVAIESLRRITCVHHDFDPSGDERARKAVLKEWRKWWKRAEPLGREGWLLQGLKDGSDRTRAACARGLFRHGTVGSISALINALGDKLSGVRESADAVLRRLTGLDMGFDPVAPDEERKKKIAAWKSWWDRNEKKDRKGWMLDALRNSLPDNRRRAAEDLAKYREPEVAKALAGALEDPVPGVRATAIQSLRKLTKAHFGFDPDASEKDRAAAVSLWREFLEKWK
ncbi:MAG: HEAT repeat domain-containing protein [Planctomycetota bacterium]|jgi:HEAT repeat protein